MYFKRVWNDFRTIAFLGIFQIFDGFMVLYAPKVLFHSGHLIGSRVTYVVWIKIRLIKPFSLNFYFVFFACLIIHINSLGMPKCILNMFGTISKRFQDFDVSRFFSASLQYVGTVWDNAIRISIGQISGNMWRLDQNQTNQAILVDSLFCVF